MTAPHITCVYGSAEGEYVIKKSRFLVHLKEVRREDEATAYIFKDVSEDDSQEACYEMVEDEDEMQAVFKVFEQMLDDVDLEM